MYTKWPNFWPFPTADFGFDWLFNLKNTVMFQYVNNTYYNTLFRVLNIPTITFFSYDPPEYCLRYNNNTGTYILMYMALCPLRTWAIICVYLYKGCRYKDNMKIWHWNFKSHLNASDLHGIRGHCRHCSIWYISRYYLLTPR